MSHDSRHQILARSYHHDAERVPVGALNSKGSMIAQLEPRLIGPSDQALFPTRGPLISFDLPGATPKMYLPAREPPHLSNIERFTYASGMLSHTKQAQCTRAHTAAD